MSFARANKRNTAAPSATAAAQGDVTTLDNFKDQQAKVLPHKKLMVVFPVIALAQMIAYLDQTSVSTAVPAIGASLSMGPSVTWVPTSFLLASTSVQLINGRLSDIVGRKPLLLICLGILAVADLCSGFAKSGAMLIAFRTIGGLGGGAINALVMIVASDITTLEQRGKYNGFIGAMVGLGNGIGPLIGGALTQNASWRWCFWYITPIIVFIMALIAVVIPPSKVAGKASAKVRMIDWFGLVINVAAVTLLLIPISQGGSIFPWDSPLVIAMLVIGAALIPAFIFVEWKIAKLPMMPIRLFQSDFSANLIFTQGFLHGVVYWSNLFYVPLYLQNVRGYSPTLSGLVILPMVASHGVGSIVSGQIISRTGRYNPTIITANGIWALGAGLQILYTRRSPIWHICIIGFLQGIGIGGAFQPSLVALLAHSRRADRAVANSMRNFLRIVGGSIGLTICSAVLNNVLRSSLAGAVPEDILAQISTSAHDVKSLGLSGDQIERVIDAYMSGIHAIFIMFSPIIFICFVIGVLVQDHGVAEKDAQSRQEPAMAGTVEPGTNAAAKNR
ncbi:hypothetical protein PWT90_01859 [Aphanocladium album]|nr:hypothetical protein PWT90_01859 [Aphanocladium album]